MKTTFKLLALVAMMAATAPSGVRAAEDSLTLSSVEAVFETTTNDGAAVTQSLQEGYGVRFQENADCRGRGKGTHDDVSNLDNLSPAFGISCIDVIAKYADSYVVFYSEANYGGASLWVRGRSRETNIAGFKRYPCNTAGVIDYWNDAIRSVRFESGPPPDCVTVIGAAAPSQAPSPQAINEIHISNGASPCSGMQTAQVVHLVNTNRSRAISATIETTIQRAPPQSATRTVVVSAGGREVLGCTKLEGFPGIFDVSYRIRGASYR